MKNVIAFMLIISTSHVFSQNFDDPEIQRLMIEAQSCYENVDQSAFKSIESQSKKIEQELKSLCDKGKEKQALTKAISYARELNALPEMQELQRCAKISQELMEKLPIPSFPQPIKPFKEEYSDGEGVCETL